MTRRHFFKLAVAIASVFSRPLTERQTVLLIDATGAPIGPAILSFAIEQIRVFDHSDLRAEIVPVGYKSGYEDEVFFDPENYEVEIHFFNYESRLVCRLRNFTAPPQLRRKIA